MPKMALLKEGMARKAWRETVNNLAAWLNRKYIYIYIYTLLGFPDIACLLRIAHKFKLNAFRDERGGGV